jgi:integrase
MNSTLPYALELKRNGRADETIEATISRLKRLARLCNIDDPEQVKTTLAIMKCKNITKHNLAQTYNGYLKYIGKTWQEPKYTIQNELPFIPTEQEIDSLIASAYTIKTACLLQILKETGARIGEIAKLQWKHVDIERKTVNIPPEKGSNARILPISTKLIAMLNNLNKPNEKIFQADKHDLRKNFEKHRKKTAKKLNNPRLKQIHFHTFRHYKGTIEYHKTKDIIHVKTILGHKSIESTMIYINLENALFLEQNDQFTCKIAHNETEAIQLIESGFEYITDIGQNKAFRKRK